MMLLSKVLKLSACLLVLLAGLGAMSHGAFASDKYSVGSLAKGDDLFACRTEKLALKIQKSGLAPENLGAAIENNDCFFLDRFDHIPQRLILRANELSVYETLAQGKNEKLGSLYIVVP
jgi:hypothetical protein